MPYSEYFDTGSQTNTYTDSYYCSAGHFNTATQGSNYYNYTRCDNTYANHWNYTSTNKGNPISLTWSSPWGGTTGAKTLSATYIAESVNAIKQLRDNMKQIEDTRQHRGTTTTPTTDLLTTSVNVGDAQFNDNNPATDEFVEDDQYDALRDSLNSLWTSIVKSGSPGLVDKAPGDQLNKVDWEAVASKTSQLGEAYTDPAYANHFNTTYNLGTYTPS